MIWPEFLRRDEWDGAPSTVINQGIRWVNNRHRSTRKEIPVSFTEPPSQGTYVAPDGQGTYVASDVRGRTDDTFETARNIKETKLSFATTEFWAMVAGIVALIIIYNVADDTSLNLWRTCLLCSLIGGAYIVSRGLAKSGARPESWRNRSTRT